MGRKDGSIQSQRAIGLINFLSLLLSLHSSRDKWGAGGPGLTSDLKWGGGAEETLLLSSLYFFGKSGGGGFPQLGERQTEDPKDQGSIWGVRMSSEQSRVSALIFFSLALLYSRLFVLVIRIC